MGFRLLSFIALCLHCVEQFRCFFRCLVFFWWSEEGLFRIFWSVDQVLQIALGCSGSLWGLFLIVVKVPGCFHEFQDVSR